MNLLFALALSTYRMTFLYDTDKEFIYCTQICGIGVFGDETVNYSSILIFFLPKEFVEETADVLHYISEYHVEKGWESAPEDHSYSGWYRSFALQPWDGKPSWASINP